MSFFDNLNTYGDSHERAFEALCNQLFERWVRANNPNSVRYFSVVNGSGGDGGVEAYAILTSGAIIGVQAKWFKTSITTKQVRDIKESITTAKKVRADLKHYVVCLPRDFQSQKIGRGKKLVKNTEEKRINNLIDEIAKSHPDLTLEFWNEHRIREELQKAGNEGIYRFWFEKEELAIEFLQQKFALAKSGWLKERYTPSLHCQGQIHHVIQKLLFTPEYRTVIAKQIEDVITQIETAKSLIDDFNQLAGSGNEFETDLNHISANLKKFCNELLRLHESIAKGDDSYMLPDLQETDIWPVKLAIEQKRLPNNLRNIKLRLLRSLEKLHRIHLSQYLTQVAKEHKPHNLIILGAPGTGKTHGTAKAVESRLDSEFPALIIRSKGTPNDSWASILHSSLGGLQAWSDSEIFSGLEALATRADQNRAIASTDQENCGNEPTKIFLCIDGVDESESADTWKVRINEVTQWIKDYPRLRFVITSRSYIPSNMNPVNLDFDEINRRFDLPSEGDVPLSELTPRYLKEYEIKFDNAPWIIGAFENALSLKLFCEEYKGQDISNSQKPVTTGLGKLLNAKIHRIEREFFDQQTPGWSETEQVIKKALFHIAETFQSRTFIEHETLSNHLTEKFDGLIDRAWAGKLLDTFANHGIILKREFSPDDGILPSSVDYSIAYQSYLDYFFAIKASQETINSGSKSLPEFLRAKSDWNGISLTATSLLNDHNILVGEDGYWEEDFDPGYIQMLQLVALSNASDEVIKRRLPDLIRMFSSSIQHRNAVLVRFVIPNLYRKELNLGIELVHNTLVGFPNTFSRDVFWSGPDKYGGDEHENIGDILSHHRLYKHHEYNQLPLIFAWSLSTTNNVYREYCRSELTNWGYHNPNGFIKLLDLVFFCGDPQIQEDLATVLLGIASLVNEPGKGLKELASWVNKNIFGIVKIQSIKNAVIRHSLRALIERAYALKECSVTARNKARPPYKSDNELLSLDTTGGPSGRGERFPIVHDLAWYVIEKSYRGFLDYSMGKKTNKEGEELLQKYRDKYGEDFGPNEFAVSAAIAFIKNLGWNREDGPGMTEATHGSMSKLATFEEKYTWLAVHEIQGYLADLLPYKNDEGQINFLEDYGLMLYVPNPASDQLMDKKGSLGSLQDSWFVPEDIAPQLDYSENTLKDDIKKWVNRKQTPNFSSWINVEGLKLTGNYKHPNKWLSLYMDTDLSEPNNIGRAFVQMICCLIEKEDFQAFLKYFKKNTNSLRWWPFDGLDHFEAKPKATTYASVKDIVWMNWIDEDYSIEELSETDELSYQIKKTVSEVIENTMENGEQYYKIPSKFIRNELSILSTDKQRFFDGSGEITALFHKHGKPYYDAQKFLVIDREKLLQALNANKLMPFWIAFQFQSTTIELKREHQDYHSQNCKLWLVWEENGKIKKHLYQNGYFRNK